MLISLKKSLTYLSQHYLNLFLTTLVLFSFQVYLWFKKFISTNISIDAILYHIQFDSPDTNKFFMHQALSYCLKSTLYVCAIFLFLNFAYTFLKSKISDHENKFFASMERISSKSGVIFLVLFLIYFVFDIKLVEYIIQKNTKSNFEKIYTNPKSIEFNLHGKYNLIILYVESLEHSLANDNIHGENLIHDIELIPGTLCQDFVPTPGTKWTMAALVSSQCAIPLKLHMANHKMLNQKFLANASCLGDVLTLSGYENYFFVPCQADFASMDNFYTTHGNHTIYSVSNWKNKHPGTAFKSWSNGITDDVLLDEAYHKIIELHKKNMPFSVSIVTTDTHSPHGHLPHNCPFNHDQKLENFQKAFKCTSHYVKNFMNQLKQQGVLKNTIVIIMGDHPFMKTTLHKNYFDGKRNVYFKIIAPTPVVLNRQKMTHHDIAPTILDILGILPKNSKRFGLGMSLVGMINQEEYENLHTSIIKNAILGHSKGYNHLWDQADKINPKN